MLKKLPDYTPWTWVIQGLVLIVGIVYAVIAVASGALGLGGLGTARDIALIVLGIQALAVALIGFILLVELALVVGGAASGDKKVRPPLLWTENSADET